MKKIVLMWCDGPQATDAAGTYSYVSTFKYYHQIVALTELASKPRSGWVHSSPASANHQEIHWVSGGQRRPAHINVDDMRCRQRCPTLFYFAIRHTREESSQCWKKKGQQWCGGVMRSHGCGWWEGTGGVGRNLDFRKARWRPLTQHFGETILARQFTWCTPELQRGWGWLVAAGAETRSPGVTSLKPSDAACVTAKGVRFRRMETELVFELVKLKN